MIYIRQNTPFVLVWEIDLQGTAIKLADTKVSVTASCARGWIDLTDYIDSIEENTITIKQNNGLAFIGDYSLMAIIESANLTTLKVQEKYVFRAIAKIDPTETESLISISSSIVASGGYDSALSEVSQNAIQNAPVAKEFGKVYQAIEELQEETENTIKESVEEVLGGVSEAYDTLKEIEEYIEKDEAGAVAFAQRITRLEAEKVSKEDIDSALSTTSENPVQNKVVTEELGKKVNSSDLATINGQRIDEGGDIVIETTTPDWNASEGEDGYIKNRTHYESVTEWSEKDFNEEDDEFIALSYLPIPADVQYIEISVKGYTNSGGKYPTRVFFAYRENDFATEYEDSETEIFYKTYMSDGHLVIEELDSNGVRLNYCKLYSIKQLDESFIPDSIARTEDVNEKLTELSEGKADKNGKYADLTAGDLYGHGESVPAEFSFRASGGKSIKDGTAYIKEIHGNSVVWNQLVYNIDSNSLSKTESGVTILDNRDGSFSITTEAEGASADVILLLATKRFKLTNHKVIMVGCPAGGGQNSYYFNDRYYGWIESGEGRIQTTAVDALSQPAITIKKGTVIANPITFKPRYYDLTKMFGAGNEPTTIEDFYRLLPSNIDLNAYNEGEVIPFTADGIKSIGDNAWDEEWKSGNINSNNGVITSGTNSIRSKDYIRVIGGQTYYVACMTTINYLNIVAYDKDKNFIRAAIDGGLANRTFSLPTNAEYIKFGVSGYGSTYKNDITISLYHSGGKAEVDNTYKPYWADTLLLDNRIRAAFTDENGVYKGMMPWDKVYNKDGKGYIVKGLGGADLGTLNWVYNAPSEGRPHGYLSVNIQGRANGKSNILCDKYIYANADLSQDKSIYGLVASPAVIIVDSSYTDAASFKAAMAGTMLYYELAEPTILEYDTPFQLDYKVADFGTEEIIGSEPSAPFKGRTIYQFNAVDQIRENYNEIQELKAILTTLQTQVANLSNN